MTAVIISVATGYNRATVFMECARANGQPHTKQFTVECTPDETRTGLTIRAITEAISLLNRACYITIVTNVPKVGKTLQNKIRLLAGNNDWHRYEPQETNHGEKYYRQTKRNYFCKEQWQAFMDCLVLKPDVRTSHEWIARIVTCDESYHGEFSMEFIKSNPEYTRLCQEYNTLYKPYSD